MLQNIKKTSKHTAIYALGNIGTKLIGLILIPLYTNADYLSHDDYGALAILEAASQLFGILAIAMSAGLSRWYWDKQYRTQQKSIFFTTITFLLFCLIPATILPISFSGAFSQFLFHSTDYIYLIKLTIYTSVVQIITTHTLVLVKLQYKSILYTAIQIIRLALTLSLILWGLHKGKGLDAIWEANLLAELFVFILLLPYIIKNIQLRFQTKVLKEMLAYGLPLMLASVSGVLLATADRYMLSSMSGLEKTGVYSLGFRIANTLKVIVTTSIMSGIMPLKVKKINEPNNQRFFSKINTYISFVFIFILIGLSLFALEGLKLFTEAKIYWEANSIVPIISFALLLGLIKDNTSIGLVIRKKTKIMGTLVFIVSLLNIGLNLLLIPLFDIYGAALATLLSQLIFCVAIAYCSHKAYPIPYEWKKIGLMIAWASLIILIGLSISELDIIIRLLIKFVLWISFPFILYLFNFYENVEIKTIRNIFKNWSNPKKIKENMSRFLK